MIPAQFERSERIFGKAGMEQFASSHVLVFGDGGVGAACAEALIRGGIGHISLVDDDDIDISNLNRQIHTSHENLGQAKVDSHKERLLSISPHAKITTLKKRLTADNVAEFYVEKVDYTADCIDTLTSKVALAQYCQDRELKIISAMGAGNKLDPTRFRVSDIFESHEDRMARAMRAALKKAGVNKLQAVWSDERLSIRSQEDESLRKALPGSTSFVPPVVGYIMAGFIFNDLAKDILNR